MDQTHKPPEVHMSPNFRSDLNLLDRWINYVLIRIDFWPLNFEAQVEMIEITVGANFLQRGGSQGVLEFPTIHIPMWVSKWAPPNTWAYLILSLNLWPTAYNIRAYFCNNNNDDMGSCFSIYALKMKMDGTGAWRAYLHCQSIPCLF